MSRDTEVGQAWIKDELFPRLKAEYQNRLRITNHYGWKTPSKPLQSTFYSEVEGMNEIQRLDIPRRFLDDCVHPHNIEPHHKVEELLRQKLESLERKKGGETIE